MKRLSLFLALIFSVALISCNSSSENNTDGKTIASKPKDKTEKKEADKPVKASPSEKALATIGGTKISVSYSSPRVKGRQVWGDLVPYDEVWRTGADEASIFETNKPLMIEGKELPAGKYAFFTIPNQDEWTVIFNTVHEQWGAFKYEEAKDALRVKVKPMAVEESMENMTFMLIESSEGEGELKLAWEKAKISVGFKVAQ